MTSRPPVTPAWLAELQARFGEALRTPLDRTSGTLTATPAEYAPELVDDVTSAARLAVYNRQYWFRLFTVLQDAFPLTARLLGFWSFNEHAARYLDAHPPRGWDLDQVPDDFASFLAAGEDGLLPMPPVVIEAARLDAAWRDVFRAPHVTPLRPTADDAARLLEMRLVRSPAVAFVCERFPLFELRRSILLDPTISRVDAPAPLPAPRHWALVHRDEGTLQLPLEPREAQLFALLTEHPVAEALARIERACSAAERASLPQRTRTWLARSVEESFWSR